MKNPVILLVLGVVLIAGSVAYEFLLKPDDTQTVQINQATQPIASSAQPKAVREILTYVPADTLLFFGGLEPGSFKDILKIAIPQESDWLTAMNWDEMHKENPEKPAPPGGRMLTGLFTEYMHAFKTPETAAANLGIKEELDSVIYTVGAMPVLRIAIDDSEAFNSFLDRAEQKSKASHVMEEFEGLTLRTYELDNDPAAKAPDLVITQQNGFALITLAVAESNRHDVLKQSLGIDKPSTSLADSSALTDLKKQYNLHPAYIGFLDHLQIVKGLTDPKGNNFGVMLDSFIQANLAKKTAAGETAEHPLATLQTAACRDELTTMVQKWPRSVAGYTKLDMDNNPMKMEALGVLEINDAGLLGDLKTLRGYVPPHLHTASSKPLLGLGLGFNMDALLPFLTKTYQDILQTPYECPPLKDMKQQLAASNGTAALGMVSGMLAGLQGASATVFSIDGSIDFENKQPNIKSAEALITLSAKNPQNFLMMIKNFVPPLAGLDIPTDGTAVDLPLPLPIPTQEGVKLAIKGKHLVAYLGATAKKAADELSNEALEQNAILAFNIDHGKYMALLSMAADDVAKEKEVAAEKQNLEALSKAMGSMDVQVNQIFDISDQGISTTATTLVGQ